MANTLDRIIQIFNNLYLSQKYGKTQITFLTAVFFPINLHFITLNQVSTYRKLNFPLTSSIYFVFLLFEMQKRLKQTTVYQTFFLTLLKRNDPQSFKGGSCNSFLQCACYWHNFDSMNVFYSMWQLKDSTFHKSLSLLRDFLTARFLLSLRPVFWKKLVFYLISKITVRCWYQSFKIK